MKNDARYKPYPRYKDSGVEWLGEIPEHWTVTRVGENAHLINGYPFDSARFDLNNGLPLVRIRDLQNQETEVRYAGPPIPEARIAEGDIIIGMDGDFAVARWRGREALLNQRLCSLRPKASIAGNFLYYLLGTPLQLINDLTHSTTVKHLSSSQVTKTKFGFPPECEQRAIGEFLDRETAKIDELIAKKERLIELLEEKRAALITHAVTRGLNPDVPLRDSGIEWLGQVPAHWQVRKLKSLAQITYGIGGELDRLALTGTPIISLPNVTIDGRLNLDDVAFTPLGEGEKKELLLEKGDLLFNWRNGSSDHVGKTALFSADGEYTNVSFLLRLRFWKSDCDSQYYRRYLNSLRSTGFFSSTKAGVNNTFNQTELQNLYVVKPPIEEQQGIADSIEGDIERVHTMVAAVLRAIERLKEYRSALITAAVTGKIDVRDQVKAAA